MQHVNQERSGTKGRPTRNELDTTDIVHPRYRCRRRRGPTGPFFGEAHMYVDQYASQVHAPIDYILQEKVSMEEFRPSA